MDDMEQLSYKNRFVRQLVQNLSTYNEADCEGKTPLVISGDSNIVILKVSLEEWTKLYSSVFVGSDIAYPDDSDNVRWILNRAVECPVSICEQIIECINNDEDVQNAIIDMLAGSERFNNYISNTVRGLTGPQITGPLIYGSCDEGVIAGKMIALVERLNINNEDALDILELGTNDEEKVAAILEGIPVADELPFGDILDFVQDILEDFQENYDAISTEERKDQLARDLWCLALGLPDCTVTYEDLYNFFDAKAGGAVNIPLTIAEIAAFIATGDFGTDDLIWYGMMWLQVSTILAGQQFFGMNAPKIAAITNDAPPSTRWEEWDPCGGSWCRRTNYAHGFADLYTPNGATGPQAVLTSSGYIANAALYNSRITLLLDMGANFTVSEMRFVFSGENAVGDLNRIYVFLPGFGTLLGSQTFTEDTVVEFTNYGRYLQIDVTSSTYYDVPITVTLTDIYISGTGTAPTWGEDCS